MSDELIETTTETVMRREEAAARLRQLADQISRHNQIEFEREGLRYSAQIPDEFPPSHTHQLLPLHDLYRPVSRLVEKITTGNVDDVVPRAIAACMTRRFAPAYLTLSAREALNRLP